MAYITRTQLKTYLGISDTSDDDFLDDIIDYAQAIIDNYTDKTFEVTSDTTRSFDFYKDIVDRTLYFDELIVSITSITNGNGEAITQYVTDPRNVPPYFGITLKWSANEYFTFNNDPQNAISVTGKWGYSETPPNDIKMAMLRLSTYLYRQKDSGVFEVTGFIESGMMEIPMGTPKIVMQILDKYRKNYRVI